MGDRVGHFELGRQQATGAGDDPKLNDPEVHYLDYFTGDFDHIAHLTNDRVRASFM